MSLVLNTLIFAKNVENGTSQLDLLDRIAKLGATVVEVRREYFKNISEELPEVHTKSVDNGLEIYYSVPDVIFENDGSLNSKIKQYFDEGMTMGAKKIKFNIGHFDNFKGDLKSTLGQFPIDEIEMNVENDQTQVSGSVSALMSFLKAVKKVGLKIGYVYDLGNWAFTNQNAEESADLLAPYTNYIHLKNIINSDNKLLTSDDLNKGIYPWKEILKHLPNNVDLALEYPMNNDEKIKEQMNLVRISEEV